MSEFSEQVVQRVLRKVHKPQQFVKRAELGRELGWPMDLETLASKYADYLLADPQPHIETKYVNSMFESPYRNQFLDSVKYSSVLSESELSALEQQGTVAYLANHYSNLDNILMGFIRFTNKKPLLRITAGDNLVKNAGARDDMAAYLLRSINVSLAARDYPKDVLANALLMEADTLYAQQGGAFGLYTTNGRPMDGNGIAKLEQDPLYLRLHAIRSSGRPVHVIPVSLSYTVYPDAIELVDQAKSREVLSNHMDALAKRHINHGQDIPRSTYVHLGQPVRVDPHAEGISPKEAREESKQIIKDLGLGIEQSKIIPYTAIHALAMRGKEPFVDASNIAGFVNGDIISQNVQLLMHRGEEYFERFNGLFSTKC